ncbi:uncharacterized protein LOC123519743 [Portunus trituberculatus]|uniref:uncharacterized protein LOC123519743 n=1 Tax=Portunus trituberculatus TaxID=210409 RepID=UPI001E1D18CD|nr:uncharacterized protein LOC123519743 [Portunus trituberculatus]
MKVGDLQQSPPLLVQQYEKTVTMVVATHQQVMCLLRGLNTQKATGPDDFSPHLLKRCFQEMAAPLTQVISPCVQENVWPSVWKEACVVPVLKKAPGRTKKTTDPYRCYRWWDALDDSRDTVVIVLLAFDKVWHRGLLEKLRAKGIQGGMLRLLVNYLQDISLKVVVNGQTSESLPVEASWRCC